MAEAVAFALHYYPAYTLDTLLELPLIQFQMLVEHGHRLKARDMLDAVTTSMAPAITEDARRQLLKALERATRDILEELDDDEGDIDTVKKMLSG